MSLVRQLLKLQARMAWARLKEQVLKPDPLAEKTWLKTRSLLRDAPFWNSRRPGPKLEDYPITAYEDYSEAIRKAFDAGGPSPLNGARVRAWSMSAGTTGPAKPFPMTIPYLRQAGEVSAAYNHYLFSKIPGYLTRPALSLISGTSRGTSPMGLPIGFGSNLLYHTTPAALARKNAIPIRLARVPGGVDTWSHVYALASDLGMISCISSRALIAYLQRIELDPDSILKRWKEEEALCPPSIA